jgi:putative two-component system response regulator
MVDGGGYPQLHYQRECAVASRLVHVCDIYDALCTTRPYREAWSSSRAVAYLRERSGTEVDGRVVDVFTRMLAAGETQVRVLDGERATLIGAAASS